MARRLASLVSLQSRTKTPLPVEEDQDSAEKWVVEACRAAKYEYRVVRYANGTVMVSDLHETDVAEVPGTEDEHQVASNAPADRIGTTTGDSAIARMEAAIAPHVAQARTTWPDAKQRYLAGLPDGHIFFVTVRLYEGDNFEQVFVRVDRIEDDGRIHGRLASPITRVSGYHQGDPIEVVEADLIDWTVARPDGTEEGNFVGKFLDTYQYEG